MALRDAGHGQGHADPSAAGSPPGARQSARAPTCVDGGSSSCPALPTTQLQAALLVSAAPRDPRDPGCVLPASREHLVLRGLGRKTPTLVRGTYAGLKLDKEATGHGQDPAPPRPWRPGGFPLTAAGTASSSGTGQPGTRDSLRAACARGPHEPPSQGIGPSGLDVGVPAVRSSYPLAPSQPPAAQAGRLLTCGHVLE